MTRLRCTASLFFGLSAASALGAEAAAPSTPPPAAPPAPSVYEVLSSVPLKFYGVIKPTFILTNAAESFSNANLTGITAAANPVFSDHPDDPAFTFQAQQSRAGLIVGEGTPLRGQVEIDFLHFDLYATPTTFAFPRLRIASAEWEPLPGHRLFLGQGWDIFSPVNPHGFNIGSGMFQAGNSGFMRQQVYWTSTIMGLEVAGALGMPTANNTPALGNLEYGLIPNAALRLSYRYQKAFWVGSSFLAAAHKSTMKDQPEARLVTLMGNLFLEVDVAPLSLKAEAYAGQNGANAGTLTLATGRHDKDLYEAGGFVSVRGALGSMHAVHGAVGIAGILNREDVVPGYKPATADAKATRTGLGIENNVMVRGSYAFNPVKWLSLYVEPFSIYTLHKLTEADEDEFRPDRLAAGVETGAFVKF